MSNTYTHKCIHNTCGTFVMSRHCSKRFMIFNSFNSQQSGSQGRDRAGNQTKFWITPKPRISFYSPFHITSRLECLADDHFTWVVCGYHVLLRVKYWNFRILKPRIFVKSSGVIRMDPICFVIVSQAYLRTRGTLKEVPPSEKELHTVSLKICSLSLVEVTQSYLFSSQ